MTSAVDSRPTLPQGGVGGCGGVTPGKPLESSGWAVQSESEDKAQEPTGQTMDHRLESRSRDNGGYPKTMNSWDGPIGKENTGQHQDKALAKSWNGPLAHWSGSKDRNGPWDNLGRPRVYYARNDDRNGPVEPGGPRSGDRNQPFVPGGTWDNHQLRYHERNRPVEPGGPWDNRGGPRTGDRNEQPVLGLNWDSKVPFYSNCNGLGEPGTPWHSLGRPQIHRPGTRDSFRFGQLSYNSFFTRHSPHPTRVKHIKGQLDICTSDSGQVSNRIRI